jgi:hypothetical protein
MEVIYKGQRLGKDDKLFHCYFSLVPEGETGRELAFKKRLGGWHRVGDVLELEEVKPGSFRVKGEVLRHIEAPVDEAEDIAARQAAQASARARKEAGRSDLLEGLEPLQRAYRRSSAPERAALITWVVRTMMGWK